MKIVITHPFCWPFVKRGSERFLDGLAKYLGDQGHEVIVLSTKPGKEETVRAGRVQWILKPEPSSRWLSRIGIGPEKAFFWPCFSYLRQAQCDVVYCLHYTDGLAARLAKWSTGTPYVLHIGGVPVRRFYRRRPLENLMLRLAAAGASDIDVSSDSARHYLREGFGHDSRTLYIATEVERFTVRTERDLDRPRILGVAAFAAPTKGARVLARAFQLLKARVPNAVLQYAGNVPEPLRRELLKEFDASVAKDVHFLGMVEDEVLRELYGQAAVTVLASVWEALGLVLVESLASGTPVVGARHGGIPEIIRDGIGTLFDPGDDREPSNAQGLASALEEALKLHQQPGLPARCRRRAEELTWEALGPGFERILLDTALANQNSLQHAKDGKPTCP